MGSHLARYILDQGGEVLGLDNLSGGFERNVPPGCDFKVVDLANEYKTWQAIDRYGHGHFDVLYHLAADATEGRSQFTPVRCVRDNVLATAVVLREAVKHRVKRIVFTSSMAVYGAQATPFDESWPRSPEDIYGCCKAWGERATEIMGDTYGIPWTICRPHNVYGPNQNLADPYRNVLAIWINRLMQGKHIFIYGDGEQRRAFSFVGDIIPALYEAGIREDARSEIINLGAREAVSLNYAARMVTSLFPGCPEPVYEMARPREVKVAYATVDKSMEILGFQETVTLRDGVKRMVDWARTLGPQKPTYLEKGLEIQSDLAPRVWREELI